MGEEIVEKMAVTLGIRPETIRTINMVREGDVTTYSMPIENCTVNECWEQVFQQAQFDKRLNGVEQFNR